MENDWRMVWDLKKKGWDMFQIPQSLTTFTHPGGESHPFVIALQVQVQVLSTNATLLFHSCFSYSAWPLPSKPCPTDLCVPGISVSRHLDTPDLIGNEPSTNTWCPYSSPDLPCVIAKQSDSSDPGLLSPECWLKIRCSWFSTAVLTSHTTSAPGAPYHGAGAAEMHSIHSLQKQLCVRIWYEKGNHRT